MKHTLSAVAFGFVVLATSCLAIGCGTDSVPLDEDAKSVRKLTPEEAQKYKGLVPGSKKSQDAANQGY